MYGKERANWLWRRHRLSAPIDLRRLVADLRLEVVSFPFQGRVKEVIISRVIGVRPRLERPWFRWYVAHGIGHYVLHVGNTLYLESWQWASDAKAERQADEFAAWLFRGPYGHQRSAAELVMPKEKMALLRELGGACDQGPVSAINCQASAFPGREPSNRVAGFQMAVPLPRQARRPHAGRCPRLGADGYRRMRRLLT